ncbi:MAG: cadmium-translocating P-type ATPase [Rhodospirillales bacterium]|jgi:P-type Cu2+ transporter|nr:cadmium-translocating P-type ATPase [Rhodospirillales bacterium]
MAACLHCGLVAPEGEDFCCPGCEAAFALVKGLGLERYYARRKIDPHVRPMKPDAEGAPLDFAAHAKTDGAGINTLHLMVEGLHCAACVWLIETVLSRQAGVTWARLNMTTRRLVLKWQGEAQLAEALLATIAALGYRAVPYDPALLDAESRGRERELLRALAVAGFAAGNVMLLSVAVWAGHYQGMGSATRDLLHWLSALIALPAIVYAGVPFFRSALSALAAARVNMDVPISIAVVLAGGMSLLDTMQGREHAYFDSAVTLLFFLLIGRYLDQRARSKARGSAEHLLALRATALTVIDPSGAHRLLPPTQVTPGMKVFASPGERIAVDGTVVSGHSDVDAGLINGESAPLAVAPGARVFAGTLNLSAPIVIDVTAVGEDTLLAEIVRLVETAEQGRARYVALADRVARWYAPVVHTLALATFLGWMLVGDAPWRDAILYAIAVLVVTCPCALGLAVPVVQVVTSGRLLRRGILVKSGTALERLAEADTVVFDKTGTLTTGKLELVGTPAPRPDDLALAASLAAASTHPLARALVRAAPEAAVHSGVREVPGQGLEAGSIRLGNREWCGVADTDEDEGPEIWLSRPGKLPVRFGFSDTLRADADTVVGSLKECGFDVELLSGDRTGAVRIMAHKAGIENWLAQRTPAQKAERLALLAASGKKVVMIGDGMNDAPALAAAHVSLSPSSAADVSQNAADMVFQGDALAPVAEAVGMARRAKLIIHQNFALAFTYNVLSVPLAMAGMVTPLIAAIAMSASSLVVILNALRLNRGPAL